MDGEESDERQRGSSQLQAQGPQMDQTVKELEERAWVNFLSRRLGAEGPEGMAENHSYSRRKSNSGEVPFDGRQPSSGPDAASSMSDYEEGSGRPSGGRIGGSGSESAQNPADMPSASGRLDMQHIRNVVLMLVMINSERKSDEEMTVRPSKMMRSMQARVEERPERVASARVEEAIETLRDRGRS